MPILKLLPMLCVCKILYWMNWNNITSLYEPITYSVSHHVLFFLYNTTAQHDADKVLSNYPFLVCKNVFTIVISQNIFDVNFERAGSVTKADILDFFLNRAEISLNSENSAKSVNLLNRSSINWTQCKDPVSYICSWCCFSILVFCTIGGRFEPFYCNDKYFCHWTCCGKFRKNSIVRFLLFS